MALLAVPVQCSGCLTVTLQAEYSPDAYGSVKASVVSAGFVSRGNESSLSYPNKPPAEPECELIPSQYGEHG